MRSQYGLIVVWVIVVSIVFVGAFILKFGNWPTSDQPSNWADFATYLSGTVGVTAVLGTLFAVVKTLGQQQKLIDSQSQMLEKQEKQLDLAQQQLDGEERRRQVELAYNCALNIIPPVVRELEKQRETRLNTFFDDLNLIGEIPQGVEVFQKVGDMFEDYGEYEWIFNMDKHWSNIIGQSLTEKAYRLGVLVSDCLFEAKELEDYFRSIIGKDEFQMVECAMLFRKNFIHSGFDRHQIALRIMDGKQSKPVLQFWHDLGERAFEKPPE